MEEIADQMRVIEAPPLTSAAVPVTKEVNWSCQRPPVSVSAKLVAEIAYCSIRLTVKPNIVTDFVG